MKNLSTSSGVTYTSSNSTPVVVGDSTFGSTNSDGVPRIGIRTGSGNAGYISSNTLVSRPHYEFLGFLMMKDKVYSATSDLMNQDVTVELDFSDVLGYSHLSMNNFAITSANINPNENKSSKFGYCQMMVNIHGYNASTGKLTLHWCCWGQGYGVPEQIGFTIYVRCFYMGVN